MRYNNNPKNRRTFLDFQRRQLELARQTEVDARRMKIASNLDKWNTLLPDSLRDAKPARLPKKLIEQLRAINLNPPHNRYVTIGSEHTMPSTFVAYSIIHALIRMGVATPSQIKTTSLLDGYSNIGGIYESRKWKNYFFDSSAKVLLIEGCSKSLTSLAPRGEDQFWRELIEFTRDESKFVIFTYAIDKSEREKRIVIPSLTNDTKLNTELIFKTELILLTKEEEEAIKNEQEKTD